MITLALFHNALFYPHLTLFLALSRPLMTHPRLARLFYLCRRSARSTRSTRSPSTRPGRRLSTPRGSVVTTASSPATVDRCLSYPFPHLICRIPFHARHIYRLLASRRHYRPARWLIQRFFHSAPSPFPASSLHLPTPCRPSPSSTRRLRPRRRLCFV